MLDVLFALFVGVLLSALAYRKKVMDASGVIGVFVIGLVTIYALGVYWFSLLLVFFVTANLVTKYKYGVKEEYGVAEKTRTIKNVLGNGLSAAIFAVAYALTKNPMFVAAYLGAMATANADTFAGEIGQVHGKPKLITTLESVRVGTDGGISVPGFHGALFGSFLIAAIPPLFTRDFSFLTIGVFSGFIGCNIDSFLGATFEKNKKHTHLVNFFATLAGGFVAMFLNLFI